MTYREVSDLYQQARLSHPAVAQMGLPKFAQLGNQLTQSDRYEAGTRTGLGGALSRLSAGLDRFIEEQAPEVVEGSRQLGGNIWERLGFDRAGGEALGEQFPRQVVDFLPAIIAGVAAPFTGGGSLLGYLGAAGTAGLVGANVFEKTGSPVQAGVQGGVTALFPWAARAGSSATLGALQKATGGALGGFAKGSTVKELTKAGTRAAAKGIGPQVGSVLRENTAKTLFDRFAGYVGGQAAAEALGESATWASTGFAYNPFEAENLLASVVGNIPFAVADAPRAFQSRKIAAVEGREPAPTPEQRVQEEIASAQQMESEDVAATATLEAPPEPAPKPTQAEELATGPYLPSDRGIADALLKFSGLNDEQLAAQLAENPLRSDGTGQTLGASTTATKAFLDRLPEHLRDPVVGRIVTQAVRRQERGIPLLNDAFRRRWMEQEMDDGRTADEAGEALATSEEAATKSLEEAPPPDQGELPLEQGPALERTEVPKQKVPAVDPVHSHRAASVETTAIQYLERFGEDSVAVKNLMENLPGWEQFALLSRENQIKLLHQLQPKTKATAGVLVDSMREIMTTAMEKIVGDPAQVESTVTSEQTGDQPHRGGLVDSRRVPLPLLIRKVLENSGLNPDEVEAGTRLATTVDRLLSLDIDYGEVVRQPDGSNILGLTERTTSRLQRIFLAADGSYRQLPKELRARTAAWVVGHEIGHALDNLGEAKQLSPKLQQRYDNWVVATDTMDQAEYRAMLKDLGVDGADTVMDQLLRQTTGRERRANLIAAWSWHYAKRRNNKTYSILRWLPQPIVDWFRSIADWGRNLVGASWGARQLTGEYSRPVTDFLRALDETKKSDRRIALDEEKLLRMGTLEPADFLAAQRMQGRGVYFGHNQKLTPIESLLGDFAEFKPTGLVETTAQAQRAGRAWYSKWFERTSNMVQRFPALRPLFMTMVRQQAYSRDIANNAYNLLVADYDVESNTFTKDRKWDEFQEVRKNKKLSQTLSDILRYEQKELGSLSLDPSSPTAKRLTAKLTGSEIELVFRLRDRVYKMMRMVNEKFVGLDQMYATHNIANAIVRRLDRKVEMGEVVEQSEKLFVAWGDGDMVKVQEVLEWVGNERIGELLVGDEKRPGLVGKLVDNHKRLQEFYRSRPAFASESQKGKFGVRWMAGPDGEPASNFAKTREGLEKVIRDIKKRYPDAVFLGEGEKIAGTDEFVPNRPSVLRELRRQEEKFKEGLAELEGRLSREELEEIKAGATFSEELERVFAVQRQNVPGSERKFQAGREFISMLENQMDYVNSASHAAVSRAVKEMQRFYMADPALKEFPDQLADMRDAIENFRKPDSPFGRAVAQGNFVYFMGMNFASHVLELSQSFFTLVPAMVSEGFGVGESYRAAGKALKDAAWYQTRAKGVREGLRTKGSKRVSADEAKMMQQAAEDGFITRGHIEDAFADPALDVMMDLRREGTRTGPVGIAKDAGRAWANFTGNFYSKFTHLNTRAALLAVYRKYRRKSTPKGEVDQDAYDKAVQVMAWTNMNVGKADRPTALFKHLPRPAAQMLWSLQSYNSAMLGLFGTFLKNGFGKVEGLSQAERRRYQKAFAVLFGTQLGAAGLLGLPFVGVGAALLEQLFPQLDLQKEIRELLHGLTGDPVMTDTVLHGGVNLVGEKMGVPIDAGSRFGMGGVLGLSSYEGFSMADMAGPTGRLVQNLVMGLQYGTDGEFTKAAEAVLPVAFKRPIELLRGQGNVIDSRGNLLYEPSSGEKIGMMMGFTPQELNRRREYSRLERRFQEADRHREMKFLDEVYELSQEDPAAARQTLLSRAQEDPSFDARAGARKIAERYISRTFPQNLLARATKGTAAELEKLAETYPITARRGVTETQRLELTSQIMTMLGFPPDYSPSAYRTAAMVDELMRSNPQMAPASAKQMAEGYQFPF